MEFLHSLYWAIQHHITLAIPQLQSCKIYPNFRKAITAPAFLIEMVQLDPGMNPGTGELAVQARFEGRIVLDRTDENATLQAQSLACDVAHIVFQNSWGMEVSPAQLLHIGPDHFKPELDAYVVWMVEWVHNFHIGLSVWEEGTLTPHTIVVRDNVSSVTYH